MTKFVPVTVSVKALPPACAVVGESELMVGDATVSWAAAVVAPPGFFTVIAKVPGEARLAVGTVAVTLVAVPAVTVRAVEPR